MIILYVCPTFLTVNSAIYTAQDRIHHIGASWTLLEASTPTAITFSAS